jgi:hypothetical protein
MSGPWVEQERQDRAEKQGRLVNRDGMPRARNFYERDVRNGPTHSIGQRTGQDLRFSAAHQQGRCGDAFDQSPLAFGVATSNPTRGHALSVKAPGDRPIGHQDDASFDRLAHQRLAVSAEQREAYRKRLLEGGVPVLVRIGNPTACRGRHHVRTDIDDHQSRDEPRTLCGHVVSGPAAE